MSVFLERKGLLEVLCNLEGASLFQGTLFFAVINLLSLTLICYNLSSLPFLPFLPALHPLLYCTHINTQERRERGQKLEETQMERERLQRKRENERIKREKEVRMCVYICTYVCTCVCAYVCMCVPQG